MEKFLALLSIILGLFCYWLKNQFKYWRKLGVPHDKPEFIYGNTRDWRKTKHIYNICDTVYQHFKGQGPFAGFYLFIRPIAVATDIEFIKNVLIKDFSYFEDRNIFHNEKDDPLTGNLFCIEGEKWRSLRQKLTPTFTSGKMKFMFPTVLEIGKEFKRIFDLKVKETKDGNLEITDWMARFTADVIGSCVFGLECNSLKNSNAEFVTMGHHAILERRHNQFIDGLIDAFPEAARKLRMRQFDDKTHDFYMNIIKDTVAFREKNNVQRNDFMKLMIDLKNSEEGLTINEIAAQAFIFFVAGFDTSSLTMSFALYELAKNPDIQEKLRLHINEVLNKYNNEFTYECMREMKYMDQIILETLRKYPIVPCLGRKTKKLYNVTDSKFYLEPGTLVLIPAYSIHYDPEFYAEPERFDPERFTEEEIQKRPACTWLPFGDGPRNCIGIRFGKMQTSIGLAFIIQNFKFSIGSKTVEKICFDKRGHFLNPLDGIYLHVERV